MEQADAVWESMCISGIYMGLRKSLVPSLQSFIFSFGDKVSFVLVGKWTPEFSGVTAPWPSRQQLKSMSGQLQK